MVLSTVQTAILSGADCGQNNCLFLLLQYNREAVAYIQAVWYELSFIQRERRNSCHQTEEDVLGEKNTSTQETSCVIVNDKY